MSTFIGYTKRPEPKWPFFVFPLAFFAVLMLLVYVFTPSKTNLPATSSTSTVSSTTTMKLISMSSPEVSSGSTVKKIIFASGMNGSLPADDLGEGPVAGGKIYCYSNLDGDEIPAEVWHVWIDPNNKVIADVHLNVTNNPAHLWSYINLYGEKKGTWQVQIKDDPKNVIASKKFQY